MIHRARGLGVGLIGLLAIAAVPAVPGPYPLDGFEYTGIRRLRAYQMVLDGQLGGRIALHPGARLPASAIRLRLQGVNDAFDIGPDTPRDSALQAGVARIVGARHPSYRIAVLDITDPLRPLYAGVRAEEGYTPGSLGKLLVMTGLFNELRRLYPDDVEARAAVLRNTNVVADQFVIPNSHEVPVVGANYSSLSHRAVRVGDVFTLWEWVDHMVSPSSNAAGSVVWKQLLLLNEFGRNYPPSPEDERAFFARTSREELSRRAIALVEEPLVAVGLDTSQLHIRSLFTATASRIIPGRSSYATPSELMRWLIRLEQGRLVDAWSSLEMKRLMYFTRRRYRYASSPALDSAAVYFKSGSLYRCQPEPEFTCGQYRGNVINLLHAVVIVEAPAGGERQRVYLVAMSSNVLRVNSAGEHQELGTRLERLNRELHP